MADLAAYRGRDVLRTAIAIRNAGDGLSAAMGIEPKEFNIGERVFVVLECEVTHHDYLAIPDTDCLELKQVFKAHGATMVDEDLVRRHLDEQADRIARARDAASGAQRLPTEDELVYQHEQGNHFILFDGCPICEEEEDARRAEDNVTEMKPAKKSTRKKPE